VHRGGGKPYSGSARQRDGHRWEDAAAAYLQARGLQVLLRRYRCRMGELDLVCKDKGVLVVVEVRARRRGSLVPALATVDALKRRKLVRATGILLGRYPAWQRLPVRFDVVGIDTLHGGSAEFHWVRDAFRADDDGAA
jgi:putative endonuclease